MEKLTANDPETRSADVIAENVDQMKALFPEALTEGKVDFDVLKQLLGGEVEEREEKYGLNWHGKRRARQLALTPSTGTYFASLPGGECRLGHDAESDDRGRQPGGAQAVGEELLREGETDLH